MWKSTYLPKILHSTEAFYKSFSLDIDNIAMVWEMKIFLFLKW